MAAIPALTIHVDHPDIPVATFDSGVWHCEGRLVTRGTAKTAYQEALFWLGIAKAEQRLQEAESK